MVTMSNEGFIKRIPIKSFIRTNFNIEDIEYREGDYNKFFFRATHWILFCSSVTKAICTESRVSTYLNLNGRKKGKN